MYTDLVGVSITLLYSPLRIRALFHLVQIEYVHQNVIRMEPAKLSDLQVS